MENKSQITIHKKDHATVTLQCDESITRELYNYFSAFATNYRFSPKFKAKMWDGRIRFFKLSTNELPIGLVYKVYEFAQKGGYSIKCNYPLSNKIERSELQKFIESLNLPFEVRPYQFEAIYQSICHKNINVLISTAGGKSLCIYIICRFMMVLKKKVILICSKTSLVEQMYKDFIDYGFNAEKYCHRIYGGQRKFYDSPIIISTWQSLITPKVKQDNPYEDFGCLICDEVHEAASDAGSIQSLARYCVNAEYRYGFSGTYPEPVSAEWHSIVGAFGKIVEFATYKFLQENDYIAKLKIYSIVLNYNSEFKQLLYDATENSNKPSEKYQIQNDLIYSNVERNKFILKLVENLKGNTLILFTKKSKHGYLLKEYFENHFGEDQILYIDGDTPLEDREDVRTLLENNTNLKLIATYGTLAAGWNVKNLNNLVLASGYKSRIKVLQSIGRSLRKHKDKDCARLFDLVDNASFKVKETGNRFINYSLDHYITRKKYYDKEDWNVKEEIFKI